MNILLFITDIIKPVTAAAINMLAAVLENFGIYAVPRAVMHKVIPAVFILNLIIFSAITFMSLLRGRFFCSTICPVGTFLGLISCRSVFGIKKDGLKCVSCSACSGVCRAVCIDEKGNVDRSRCILCLDCLDSCGKDAFSYGFFRQEKQLYNNSKSSKREFVRGTIAILVFSYDGGPGKEH